MSPARSACCGESFAEGKAGALDALRHLARHPATCRRLARRIAIHFIADDPPEPAVAALERILLDSGTDLGAAARTLIGLPEAWEPLAKLASPQDYAIGVLRALGLGPEGASALLMALDRLGQPVWTAPAPDGWPDRGRAWAAPDLVVRRLEWASDLAGRLDVAARQDPLELLALTRGAFAPPAVRQGISAAATLRDGYILALAHPGMHRR
jgi:uncharacterized protein (DUF1800 family)